MFLSLNESDGFRNGNQGFAYDQIHHISVIQVSNDPDWPEAEPISAKNLTLLINSETEQTAYYIGRDVRDGPHHAEHFFEVIPDYIDAIFKELRNQLPIPIEHLSSTHELFVGMLQDDLGDFNFETNLNAELKNIEDIDLGMYLGNVGFRLLSIHNCNCSLQDITFFKDGETISDEGKLFGYLEQGEGKYCFLQGL